MLGPDSILYFTLKKYYSISLEKKILYSPDDTLSHINEHKHIRMAEPRDYFERFLNLMVISQMPPAPQHLSRPSLLLALAMTTSMSDEQPNNKTKSSNAHTSSTEEQHIDDSDSTKSKDCDAIQQFLQNLPAVSIQLYRLNGILTELAKEEATVDPKTGRFIFPRRFLSNYFKDWAREHQFSGIEKMIDFGENNVFFSALANGKLLKDKFFGGSAHGEWTHFIQWWCLVEENKRKPFLTNPPDQLLRWIGSRAPDQWSDCFELGVHAGAPFKRGFGSVFECHATLMSPDAQQHLPVLHQALQEREKKRAINWSKYRLPRLFPPIIPATKYSTEAYDLNSKKFGM
jgi:hypothetical protein